MKITQRAYTRGDEENINKLYETVAGIVRNVQEFEWEWIYTWDKKGCSWLAFDEDRPADDQLIMQYSLISTPFSFWGKSYLAGKTENCMCHPEYRGKRLYFPHEQKYFEEAKKRFQLFFTTAGNATKGAPGAVRRKLGYVAFDSWTQYSFFIKKKYLKKSFLALLKDRKKIPIRLAGFLSGLGSQLFAFYFSLFLPHRPVADIRIITKNDAPLHEIENFWNRNKSSYMITIDRQSAYLAWRINENPYFEYKYLLYYRENKLAGYIIFAVNKNNVCVIEDILAESRDMAIFDTMISSLIWHAKDMGADAVSCSTLAGNTILKEAFRKKRFIDLETFRRIIERKQSLNAFHVYISPEIESKLNPLDPRNWYLTALISEGRTH